MGNHKFLKAVTAIAAVGGVCYLFKDKIKESNIYQSMDVDDKVEKVKTTIKEKMPTKKDADTDRDYFTLNDDDITVSGVSQDVSEAEADVKTEGATETEAATDTEAAETDTTFDAGTDTVSKEEAATSSSDLSAMVDDLLADIPDINSTKNDSDSPLLYENEGLSDSSVEDDFDVLSEQDKLDF